MMNIGGQNSWNVKSVPKQNKKIILLIDDDESANFLNNIFVDEVVADYIETSSFMIATQALAHLDSLEAGEESVEAVIFLDINMPVMDGFEFLEAVKSKGYQKVRLTIIMLSSSSHPSDRKRAAAYNVYRYVVKPLNRKLLRDLMQQLKIPLH